MTSKFLAFFTTIAVASVILGAVDSLEKHRAKEYWYAQFVKEQGPAELIVLEVHDWTHVVVTMYHPVVEQCDDTPDELASGRKIQIDRASEYRYCAVSWNLLERYGGQYRFGDIIVLKGVGEFNGPWRIEDLMNPRWENRIDLLLTPGAPARSFANALMRRA